jgi:hypothetical protein
VTKRIMLDLETADTAPSALVLSIGAVAFDPAEGLSHKFYNELKWDDQYKAGRTCNPNTVSWWTQQSDEARKVWQTKLPGGFDREKQITINALAHFADFLALVGGGGDVQVWAYGADFDCVVLGSLYEAMGVRRPWSYSKNRCHRTLVDMAKGLVQAPEREGTHHNALDDAIYQAKCAIVYLNRLGVK